MKRATLLTVLLASGVLVMSVQASAQQAPATQESVAPDFLTGNLTINAQGATNVASSKFQEYRDIPNGGTIPEFRLFGFQKGVAFDLRGSNVSLKDERYTGYIKVGQVGISGDYNAIIHNIGFGGRTLLTEQSPGVWRMSPVLQQAFQSRIESTTNANRVFTTFIQPLFGPSLADGNVVDISVQRLRSNIVVDVAKNKPFSLQVNYTREQRHGSGGMSGNNTGYIIETPSVTEYLTQDSGFNAALNQAWGNVRGAFHYNTFTDQVSALRWDNPLVATDGLSVNIPSSGALATGFGGASTGLDPTPPSNTAYTGAFGTTIKLPAHTRINADVTMGNMTQNEQLFPFATNTALITPVVASSTASLPVQSPDGKIVTTSLIFGLTSRPVAPLQINVRYNSYDADNQSPRVTFANGLAAADYRWAATPRITAPYSIKNARLDLTAGYNVGPVTIEGGFRQTKISRTYRETAETTENGGSVAAVLHISEVANVRAVYEKASRDYSDLELGRSEDGTLVTPGAGLPANVLERAGNLRYDQAQRDADRVGLNFDLSVGNATTFTVSYLRNNDTYNNTVHGLQNVKYNTVTGEVSVSPSERWNLFAYYTYEKNGNSMVSSGNSPFLPVNDFTSLAEDKGDSVGFGTMFQVVPTKVTANLSATYQKVDGNIHFTVDPASAGALARVAYGGVKDPTNVDDTKITRVDASLAYTIAPAWTVTGGAWYENYSISDYETTGLQNLYPSAFFLAANDGSYHATVGYVRLSYRW